MAALSMRPHTHVISSAREEELGFSRDNLIVQRVPVWDLCRKTVNPIYDSDRNTNGLYLFYKAGPPHLVYFGRSEDLEFRVVGQRRLRSTYSYVLIFRLEGYVDFGTLAELEVCALRMASERWKWAKWDNERDIFAAGDAPCKRPVNPALLSFLEKLLTRAEAFIQNSPYFDPSPVQPLSTSHQIGSPYDELCAFGAAHPRGMTVLKGSRMPLSVRFRSDLRPLGPEHEAFAVKLYREGILDHWRRTNYREEGLYFTQDYRFSSKESAASFISLMRRPATAWKPVHSGEAALVLRSSGIGASRD